MCPICSHDSLTVGTNTAYLSTGPRVLSWLVCCHCGWESEILENPSQQDLESLTKISTN